MEEGHHLPPTTADVHQQHQQQHQCSCGQDFFLGEGEGHDDVSASLMLVASSRRRSLVLSSPSSAVAAAFRSLPPIPEYGYLGEEGGDGEEDEEDEEEEEDAASSSSSSASSLSPPSATLAAASSSPETPPLSHSELAFEWSMLCQDCTDCWTRTGKRTQCFCFSFLIMPAVIHAFLPQCERSIYYT